MTQPEQTDGEQGRPANRGKLAKDLNEAIRYTMWSVFHLRDPLGPDEGPDGTPAGADRGAEARELEKLFGELAERVTVRGTYDVSGLRADAEVLLWTHAETVEDLQELYSRFRRTAFGRRLDPVWSQV